MFERIIDKLFSVKRGKKLVMRGKEENNGYIVLPKTRVNEIERITNAIVESAINKQSEFLSFEKERAFKLIFNACNRR